MLWLKNDIDDDTGSSLIKTCSHLGFVKGVYKETGSATLPKQNVLIKEPRLEKPCSSVDIEANDFTIGQHGHDDVAILHVVRLAVEGLNVEANRS